MLLAKTAHLPRARACVPPGSGGPGYGISGVVPIC
jgi:hypothetical protein